MQNKRSLKTVGVITLVIAILLIIVGTYASLNFDVLIQGNKENQINNCNLNFKFKEENAINLLAAYPISDDKITEYTPYTFTITNQGNCNEANYKITLRDICNTCTKTDNICTVNDQQLNCSDSYKINSSKVKYQLVNKATNETKSDINPENVEITGSLSKDETFSYDLKLWIDSSATNEDLYVYENGKVKENSDGSIVTKNVGFGLNIESWDGERVESNPTTPTNPLIAKVGTDGLVAESHPATEQTTATTSYRYTGANPDNYVSFNNELWRIIGVFDVDDGTGKLEQRIKLMRKDSIGNVAWDYKSDDTCSNDWTNATAMTLLNMGDYWNRTGAYLSIGLTTEAKSMINDAKWYLGGVNNIELPARGFYEWERGTTVYSTNSSSWVGKVGLMYPSDYIYATGGGYIANRKRCLVIDSVYWFDGAYDDCRNNDWLYNQEATTSEFTITSFVDYSDGVLSITRNSEISYGDNASNSFSIRPSIYLSSDVSISGGTGTQSDPYTLSKK